MRVWINLLTIRSWQYYKQQQAGKKRVFQIAHRRNLFNMAYLLWQTIITQNPDGTFPLIKYIINFMNQKTIMPDTNLLITKKYNVLNKTIHI